MGFIHEQRRWLSDSIQYCKGGVSNKKRKVSNQMASATRAKALCPQNLNELSNILKQTHNTADAPGANLQYGISATARRTLLGLQRSIDLRQMSSTIAETFNLLSEHGIASTVNKIKVEAQTRDDLKHIQACASKNPNVHFKAYCPTQLRTEMGKEPIAPNLAIKDNSIIRTALSYFEIKRAK